MDYQTEKIAEKAVDALWQIANELKDINIVLKHIRKTLDEINSGVLNIEPE